MNRTSLFGVAVVLAVAAIGWISFSPSTGQEPKASARVKWEYRELSEEKLTTEGGLDKLGEQGWELMQVDPKLPYLTRTNPAGVTTVAYTPRLYYFKRAK